MDWQTTLSQVHNSSSTVIQHSVDQFQIAQGYFSDIIGIQTAIFSLIVASIVALNFLFNWKISRDYIKKEVDDYSKKLKDENDREFSEKMENLQNIFSSGMARHEKEIGKLSGWNYRTLGQFWQSEELYPTAFIWWFRGAHQFAKISEDRLTRICLSHAKKLP